MSRVGKVSIRFLSVVLAILLGTVVVAQTPGWVTDHQANYPSAFYITGVGIDTALAEAKEKARAEIAGQIRSTIHSEITDIEEELQIEGTSTLRSEFTQKIREVTEVTLSGVTYPKSEQRGGSYYVLAVLDKSQYLQDINVRLDDRLGELTGKHSAIRNHLMNGDVLPVYRQLDELEESLQEFVGLRSIYNSVSEIAYDQKPDFTLSGLRSEAAAVIQTVSLSVVRGENQTGELGEPLPDPIVVQANATHSGKTIPVSGLVLAFRDAAGNTLGEREIDSDGRAEIQPVAFPDHSPDRGVVNVSFTSLPSPELRAALRNKRLQVNYGIRPPDYTFHVEVLSDGTNDLEPIRQQLMSLLSDMGFTISRNAPAAIRISVTSSQNREVKGFAGTQHLSEITLGLHLIDRSTDVQLGQQTLTGRGMSNNDPSEARSMALRNTSFSSAEFATLIAATKEKLDGLYK